MLKDFLVKSWYKKSFWLYFLLPLSWVYQLGLAIRKTLYKYGILKQHQFNIPIIVVGNLTVGGTGKTPLVIALVEYFKKQGLTPGVITRGYGGQIKKKPVFVGKNSDPHVVGDEALLIFLRTEVPVAVCAKRTNAAKKLIDETDCNIIISDDGLQHTALSRDMEIIVIDGQRRLGNELCLPAGPLRESKKRLKTVDFIVCNGVPGVDEYGMQLEIDSLYNLKDPNLTTELLELKQPIYAVAGIGNPERFFRTLKEFQCSVKPIFFPDHHKFTKQDLAFKNPYPVVMTEKDAIKCKKFAHENHWVLKVNAEIDELVLSNINKVLKINSQANI